MASFKIFFFISTPNNWHQRVSSHVVTPNVNQVYFNSCVQCASTPTINIVLAIDKANPLRRHIYFDEAIPTLDGCRWFEENPCINDFFILLVGTSSLEKNSLSDP
jgi:hypothetical protein